MSERLFLRPEFHGKRFEGGHMPVEVFGELAAYRKLLLSVAKHLFKQEHPRRQRLPKGFEDGLVLWVSEVEKGSACPMIMRNVPEPKHQVGLQLVTTDDYFEAAKNLIGEVVENPRRAVELPADAFKHFNAFGSSLTDDERIVLATPGGPRPVYTRQRRKEIALLKDATYEDAVDVVGVVSVVDAQRRSFSLRLEHGGAVQSPFTSDQIHLLRQVLGREDVPVQVIGRGRRNADDELLSIEVVEEIIALQDDPSLEVLDVATRLGELASLSDGWLDGSGRPPSEASMTAAAEILREMERLGCSRPYIYPTVEAGLQAEWSFDEGEVSIEIDDSAGRAAFMGVHVPTQADTEQEVDLADPTGAASVLWKLVSRFATASPMGRIA